MADFELNTRQLRTALREYERATGKDCADILNRAGRNVAARAIQFTPRATAAKIKADLRRGKAAIWATIRRLKRAGTQQRGMSRAQFGQEVQKTINLRASSAGYVASGWFHAFEAFGGRGRKRSSSRQPAPGSGRPATAERLVAVLINAATGAEKVGQEALQRAVDAVATDMLTHAQKKLSATARKFSAR